MELMLYEDQTGLMLFPEKRLDKDNKIVSFFNNSVDLYIEKVGNSLKIYCHLIAYKTSTRPLGYYIIYKDFYNDNIFTNLKMESRKILDGLELQPRTGHTDNIIFENIEKFDNKYQQYNDIDIVLDTINFGKNLDYSAGNISEISAFCKDILRKSNNIKISISSKKNELGNVNILINKKYAESLRKAESTEYALNETRERLKEKDKKEKGEPGRIKVKEGFTTVKQGIDILKNAGYDLPEIQELLNGMTLGEIFALQIKGIEIGKNEFDRREKIKREKIRDKEIVEEKTGSFADIIIKAGVLIAILAVIFSAIVFFVPDFKEKFKNSSEDIINKYLFKGNNPPPDLTTPTPTKTENITPTPTPTPTIIPIITKTKPNIIAVDPDTLLVNKTNIYTKDNSTFTIAVDQTVNVTWFINENEVYFEENVTKSKYVNNSPKIGKWHINAVANNSNGSTSHAWDWNVIK